MRIIRTAFFCWESSHFFLMMVGQLFLAGENGMTPGLGNCDLHECVRLFLFSDKNRFTLQAARGPFRAKSCRDSYAVMERLAAKANLPVPKLYVIPEAAPNAFCNWQKTRGMLSVAVTEGLFATHE